VLIDRIAINGNDDTNVIRYNIHFMTSNVYFYGQLIILYRFHKNGVCLIDVVAGYKSPFIGQYEWYHAVVQSDQDLRINRADLCEEET